MDRKTQLRLVTSLANASPCNLTAASEGCEAREHSFGEKISSELSKTNAKRKSSKAKKVDVVQQQESGLSVTAQSNLLKVYLSEGWGRAAHGLIRLLKSPKKAHLKIAEIAVIMTVYDATVAEVNPRMFAPLSSEDFEHETGVDRRDIFRTLSTLVSKGLLLKVKQGQVNFWGLNPHFLTLKDKSQNRGEKSPMGNLPMGIAPSDKVGELPTSLGGEKSHGESGLSCEKQEENCSAKNLNQESLKESHLGEVIADEFPKDLVARWRGMKTKGLEHKASNEREIFLQLLPIHKQPFFESCGSVVAFLEKYGAPKNGKIQKIHSPMIWIRDHWEHNFARYLSWRAEQKGSEERVAEELNRKALGASQINPASQTEEQALREDEDFKSKWNAVADRFLSTYSDKGSCEAFVREALFLAESSYLNSYYASYGWNNPIVRHKVLEHYLKVETGEILTKVLPSKKGGQNE